MFWYFCTDLIREGYLFSWPRNCAIQKGEDHHSFDAVASCRTWESASWNAWPPFWQSSISKQEAIWLAKNSIHRNVNLNLKKNRIKTELHQAQKSIVLFIENEKEVHLWSVSLSMGPNSKEWQCKTLLYSPQPIWQPWTNPLWSFKRSPPPPYLLMASWCSFSFL